MSETGTAAPEQRTTPIELFWDLVFVFAVTQVSTLLYHDLSWTGAGKALLVLALVWWAWSAFVWAINAQAPDDPVVRGVLFTAIVLAFLVALAVPEAWGTEATAFALAYTGLRLLHLGLYVEASHRGRASFAAIAGFGITVLVGMALLIVGARVGHGARAVLWMAAAAIDYAGPAWLTRERLRGIQRVAVAHFAERYSLFIIICLGESVVAIGVGAAGHELERGLAAAAVLTLLVTIGLWWTYFDRVAAQAEARLATHEEPVLAAADAYSYLHLVLVTGIIVFAVGAKGTVAYATDPLSSGARLALCGGVALYLAGHTAFVRRLLGSFSVPKALGAAACLAVYLATATLAAWATAGLLAGVLTLVVVADRSRQA